MYDANRIVINILLGLIIAVIAGLSAGGARASTIDCSAGFDMLQGDTGSSFVTGRAVSGFVTNSSSDSYRRKA